MRGGGWNAENSQASDGRRAPLLKCRDCPNVVRSPRSRLCSDCNLHIFERRKRAALARATQRYQPAPKRFVGRAMSIDDLSRELAGLQKFWLSTVGEAFTTITGSTA